MSLNIANIKASLLRLNAALDSSEIKRFSMKKKINPEDVDEIIDALCTLLMSNPQQSVVVRNSFEYLLLPIVCKLLESADNDNCDYQVMCFVLSVLSENGNLQVARYCLQFFSGKKRAPFQDGVNNSTEHKKKKRRVSSSLSDLDVVKMCLRFLRLDLAFFRRTWDWTEFIERYHNKGCDMQKLLCNRIASLIFGINSCQQAELNSSISDDVMVKSELNVGEEATTYFADTEEEGLIEWKFKSDKLMNVEGIYLPIFNKPVADFYSSTLDIVQVNSTRINMRSLALGISSGKAICLSGQVGSGKTSLVEFMAKKVGRLPPKKEEFREYIESKRQLHARASNGNGKRKIENGSNVQEMDVQTPGFLRIQLGDQTDSKVLLGQYRCTDIPGEFIWQPGILTKAVMNGHWLLLEDIDSATQDVCAILTHLLENNFLRVPGFRENLKITHGFQLFMTLRTHKNATHSSNSAYALLEKHLYTINILPLSRSELSTVICQNYPKLATVATRIVDVFLIFSRGGHEADCDDMDSMSNTSSKKRQEDEVLPYASRVSALPNSGRMVSTRDLLKLCNRSSQTFEATSAECAYLVFQNCVDLFCSHLPAGELKTDLIVSIGARLGIIESRCIHLANEYKPKPTVSSEEIAIGRAKLSIEADADEKRSKMDDENDENKLRILRSKQAPPTFSFTRVSSCVLERIAVAVQQNEPVLLVGETGTGKTSSVQYLAYQTNHRLVVVNMNNQSDVSDLIGGFKPVDIGFIISPLRNEFEILFARTFDIIKNEKFLCHIAGCFNRADYPILVKLMLKVVGNAYKVAKGESDLLRWQTLEKKLKKLDNQLKTSTNLAFAFIPGSLVNCIRNGDWVLLDEINLASTETLECLSTILEPGGSVILLERGDFVPIKRHPNFRLFACMNPSTDVGKKDLPVGIRNRFSEFFVDELTNESDLQTLIGDYLNNTGIDKSRIRQAVLLYVSLRHLSQLELNDGLGNKPVFSLRTLCRALKTCSKNLCGSTERNIYESFCLSFLTQLDSDSHLKVLKKIQHHLVSDVKKVLSQSIPKPNKVVTNFEGYWVENGEKEPQECKEYILTESVQKNLKDLARIISIGKLPILLQGPTSAGKTSLIEFIAKRTGNHCLRINNHEHTDLQEYVGTYVADMSGKLSFQEGVLVKAMRNGFWIILDELNLAPSDILEALNRVLDDNRELYIPETQTLVKAHPNFMLFATQNPPGLYGGRKTLSRAFKNRFVELHFSEIPKNELEIILEKRCLIPMKYAQKMVQTMTALQVNRRTTTKNNFTLRDLFRWGNRYTYADTRLLEDRNYDWNQHLVDEGYLVLSAKIRNPIETEIIVDTLFKKFSKKISIDNLFTLSADTSMVTKGILEQLVSYSGSQHVVWTFEMRRMAVLVSKSLQFSEPVLLVGPTGCGKTTVCQLLAELRGKILRILNCHMHTESADFLGGLRPYRESRENCDDKSTQLFEWSNGPLVYSMMEGNFFLADEISLAEDSVLERLNCVLEPERTLLLAEKSGTGECSDNSEFIIKAHEEFQFLATMNPGGDFGKKELSPALRNRFTEIWCTAVYSDEDLTKIAVNSMQLSSDHADIERIAQVIVKTVAVVKANVEKLNFSIRDVLAWVNYITKNFSGVDKNQSTLNLDGALFFGLHTVFLDALEMLPYENINEIVSIREKIVNEMRKIFHAAFTRSMDLKGIIDVESSEVTMDALKFGIQPFFLSVNECEMSKSKFFSFSAPTTKRNLFRVLSALSVKKAILLEGPPGVGKSSLIENIASTIGYNLVRINLCEHTDIADLFGTDLPAENSIFETENNELRLGSFVWRDGPLLAALKAPNTWILLDELNLAPQSVLEGLNAILDHRGEVYIPELNKTFRLGQETRIFATQNPLRQGGGRKGLPQSFLNRFTKVYLRKLERVDLLHVVKHNFGFLDRIDGLANFDLLGKMVEFSEKLESGITNLEFGYRGGPYEANLRDMLRWCELLTSEETGYNFKNTDASMRDFLLVLFEKMKLVYCQRMRTEADIHHIVDIFAQVFECNATELLDESSSVGLYWNDSSVFLDDIQWNRASTRDDISNLNDNQHGSIVLSSQLENLKNLAECVMLKKPVIFCGPTDCGKTKIINTFCSIFSKELQLDTIDDSVTGSFQQFDFNRMLEELWQRIEGIAFRKFRESLLEKQHFQKFAKLFKQWREYEMDTEELTTSEEDKNTEVDNFCKRLGIVESMLVTLQSICSESDACDFDKMMSDVKLWRNFLEKSSATLNAGGHFEWIDSVIVKSIKFGHFICLEHVNLVSSAVLDRLNPILEPNGSLMIAEKGVDQNNQPETISKHSNFQMFLTMDPKYGEVSRAMRNRCIELSIPHQNYCENDLRKLVHLQGVREMYMIKAIIAIHKSVCSLSDFTNFGVSHVVKMSFLVAQNKAMGVGDKKCLSLSALEVYVRSSHFDLLGFGLDYYKDKLKESIMGVVRNLRPCKSLVNQENLLLHSSELTTMKLIELQAEPLLALLRADKTSLRETLNSLNPQFDELQIESPEETAKYMLTFVYMMSTFSDVNRREIYLHEMLSTLNAKKLANLNSYLYETVKSFASNVQAEIPWDSAMFKRLRPYNEEKLEPSQIFTITVSLIMQLVVKEVTTRKTFDLKNIDVITYAKGVQTRALADTVDNKFVRELYKLLSEFKSYAWSALRAANVKIEEQNYKKLLLSFLWFNRMLEVSTKRLLEHNNVTPDLLDELYLHFKWFSKNCVNHFASMCEGSASHSFARTFNETQNFILSHHHSLQLYKKVYVLDYTSFHPLYDDAQIKRYKQLELLNNLVTIIPKMNENREFHDYQKRLTLLMSTSYQDYRRQIYVNCNDHINDALGAFNQTWTAEMKSTSELNQLWIDQYQSLDLPEGFVKRLQQQISKFEEFLHMEDISVDFHRTKYGIEILPILEYYIIKALPLAAMSSSCAINEEYVLSTQSIDSSVLLLIRILNDPRYSLLQKISGDAEGTLSREFTKNYSSFKMIVNHGIQSTIQKSLVVNNGLCRSYNNKENYATQSNQMFENNALLTHNVLSLLVDKNGESREIGLGEIQQWMHTLATLNKLLWANAEMNGSKYNVLSNALQSSEKNARQLLLDIDAVKMKCQLIENENFSDFNKDFWKAVENLSDAVNATDSWSKNYLTESLCGVIQLNLLSYFPLIDPVKKSRLKSKYLQEDIDHLSQLLLSYKFMSIMLNYRDLGKDSRVLLEKQVEDLREKLVKRSRKVALRPEISLYSSMTKDVSHFLSSCCHPKQLCDILDAAKSVLEQHKSPLAARNETNELMSKINLWIINADKFTSHTMRSYSGYYRDFILPIECSITLLKNGLLGLRSLLLTKHDSLEIDEHHELSRTMQELIAFPSHSYSQSKQNVFSLIKEVDESETVFFELIKSQIRQIKNVSALASGKIDSNIFKRFDGVLNFCNQLWQKQEECRRRKQIEEDSLYVTKTKCAEEKEEVVRAREISEIFPENTDRDFNEFVQQETLEQIVPAGDEKKPKKVDIIRDEDYKSIGEFFIALMSEGASGSKDKDYLAVFEHKLKVFHTLFDRYKNCVDCSFDTASYNSLGLLIAKCREAFNEIHLRDTSSQVTAHNFYKDSNISEALTCLEVMKKLEQRVLTELEQWPDHAVLNDLIIIINRIRGFSSQSPLVRFNVGMQILRKKVAEWNSVAHRLNNFKDLECEVAEIIQRWMQMELQCWRESLNQTFERAQGRAYRYWFFLYNLIHEYLTGESDAEIDTSLTDFKKAEKRFATDEVNEEKSEKEKVSIGAVESVLKQFIETSSYAEFPVRMSLLQSYKVYLVWLNKSMQSPKVSQLIALIHNLREFFMQFSHKVQEYISTVRKPIEDKLRKFVKINSFNKDLSYFNTESNIKQVHRNLHKHLKEFEVETAKKISELFIYKDPGVDLDPNHQKENQNAPHPLNYESFIIAHSIGDHHDEANSKELLHNINRYISKSQSLVRDVISHVPYPKLTTAIAEFIDDELETCNHLRALKVDENLPKNKQKSQAKSILNQKRKSLADFFKIMTTLGINYKTGLLTNALNNELVDLHVTPFDIGQLNFADTHASVVRESSAKLDLYFNKSIFKVKLLINLLLQPRSDIDFAFHERIKGFAIDLFTLVQDQRKSLAENVNLLIELKRHLRDIDAVKTTKSLVSYENEQDKLSVLKESFMHVAEILEQFKLLMMTAPENVDEEHLKVIVSTNNSLHKQSQVYRKICSVTEGLLATVGENCSSLASLESRFVTNTAGYISTLQEYNAKLQELRELFVVDSEYSTFGSPIVELCLYTGNQLKLLKSFGEKKIQHPSEIEGDLEKLAHAILLTIQNLYKEHRDSESRESKDENAFEEGHLKEMLHKNLAKDTSTLQLKEINGILATIFKSAFVSTDAQKIELFLRIHPLIQQYKLLADYFIIQQICAHKSSVKMLSVMLSVFLELAKNGFCVPEHLLSDEEQKQEGDSKTGDGFGFEDGEGEKDVSNKLESEDQLDEAKRPEDYNKGDQEEKQCKEEKGIDMSENFEGQMHDVDENNSDSDDPNEDDDEEMDKEMGETKEGADKLDDQIWGSDDEHEKEENEEEKKDEKGKGSGEKDDKHNDLDAETDGGDQQQQKPEQQEDGLDAAADMDEKERKKQQQKQDIDQMNDQGEEDEEQTNSYHNQLEEPPEPEDFDLNNDFNLDGGDKEEKEPENEENPFDIDSMKEKMDTTDDPIDNSVDENEKDGQEQKDATSDASDDDENGEEKLDDLAEDQENENDTTPEEKEGDSSLTQPDNINSEEENAEKPQELPSDYHESKDKESKEENIQSMPNQKDKGSRDQVQMEKSEESVQQNMDIDDQDTGEDKEGVGQAENQESKSGHQGVSEARENRSQKNQKRDEMQQKRKKGNTNEERTLGDVDKMEKKFLKTVEKLNQEKKDDTNPEVDENQDTDEYQHVKDAKKNDKSTLDNATEEQSHKIQHEENADDTAQEKEEPRDDLMDIDEKPEPEMIKNDEMRSKKLEAKSEKPSKRDDRLKDRLENPEEVEVEGENVVTFSVPRGDETTAHCQMDIVNDSTMCEEQSQAEALEIRKMVESEMMSQKVPLAEISDMEKWQDVSNRMMSNARELCEQLRLILEPTKCTRLKGDYRTGRRINMKKIIPYIASQFRKDKIWLRRTKAAQRDYKITIAVDDSKSMDHNNSKELTLQTISLVSQALTLLESGKLSVVSFGETTKIILKYNEQFNGPNLVKSLNFDQNKTRIAELLDFARVMNQEDSSSDSSLFEHLMIVLSDGRNIFAEGEQRVRNAVKMARLQRMFLIYVIIDNPSNKNSILDVQSVLSTPEKGIKIVPYMDQFPFPYYVIVRDLNQLPLVLSEGLRQWFELVNSEQ